MYENTFNFSVRDWTQKELSKLLKFDVPLQLVGVVLSKNTNEELEAYLKGLLDFQDPRTHQFITELIKRKGPAHLGFKKPPVVENDAPAKKQKKNKKKQKKGSSIESTSDHSTDQSKNKVKYVPFSTRPDEVWLKPGRHYCVCEAQLHNLVNNCLSCGRIVCEQEGSGPCFFCGSLVCSKDEEEMIKKGTTESSDLYEKLLLKGKPDTKLQEEMNKAEKLRQYDRNCSERTKVIDARDYYCWTNVWLSQEERDDLKLKEEEARKKRLLLKYTRKITLDMKGLQIVENESDSEDEDNIDSNRANKNEQKVIRGTSAASNVTSKRDIGDEDTSAKTEDNSVENFKMPKGIDNISSSKNAEAVTSKYKELPKNMHDVLDAKTRNLKVINTCKRNAGNFVTSSRVLDDWYYNEDEGYCFSIKQPYASLLIHGIKKHEGRLWYTSYRGKLWISSGKVKPTAQEISHALSLYRHLVEPGKDEYFPTLFPTGVILGWAVLKDCLSQDEYRLKYPNGEIEDPYVLIFDDAEISPVQLAIKGKPCIFPLDRNDYELLLLALNQKDEYQRVKAKPR